MLSILGASLSYLVFVHRLPAHAVYSAIMLFLQSILSLQHTQDFCGALANQQCAKIGVLSKFMHRKHVHLYIHVHRLLVDVSSRSPSESQSQVSVSLSTQPARYIVPKITHLVSWWQHRAGFPLSVRAPCSNERCCLLCTCTTVLLIE